MLRAPYSVVKAKIMEAAWKVHVLVVVKSYAICFFAFAGLVTVAVANILTGRAECAATVSRDCVYFYWQGVVMLYLTALGGVYFMGYVPLMNRLVMRVTNVITLAVMFVSLLLLDAETHAWVRTGNLFIYAQILPQQTPNGVDDEGEDDDQCQHHRDNADHKERFRHRQDVLDVADV